MDTERKYLSETTERHRHTNRHSSIFMQARLILRSQWYLIEDGSAGSPDFRLHVGKGAIPHMSISRNRRFTESGPNGSTN